ncbi:phosphatase PAP2 family protein [Fructobacillus durionis]|nr:phosphatase PAP2 family protein [Fructobacillus durionis]
MNRSSLVGDFFQKYGTKGPNIVLFSCFEIIAWTIYCSKRARLERLLLTATFLIFAMHQVLLGVNGYFAYTLARLLNENIKTVADVGLQEWIAAFAFTVVISYFFYRYVEQQEGAERAYLLKAAVFGIALVFIVSVIIGDLKLHWGRYRPFQMDANMSQFTPWYQPNGSNGHFSFPSGHTTSGWLLVYLTFLLPRSYRQAQKYVLILTVILAVTIALSRVRYGAHWLSDVTAASLIVGSMIFITSRVLKAHLIEEALPNS